MPQAAVRPYGENINKSSLVEFSLFDTDRVPLPYLSDAWWKDRESDCQPADDP